MGQEEAASMGPSPSLSRRCEKNPKERRGDVRPAPASPVRGRSGARNARPGAHAGGRAIRAKQGPRPGPAAGSAEGTDEGGTTCRTHSGGARLRIARPARRLARAGAHAPPRNARAHYARERRAPPATGVRDRGPARRPRRPANGSRPACCRPLMPPRTPDWGPGQAWVTVRGSVGAAVEGCLFEFGSRRKRMVMPGMDRGYAHGAGGLMTKHDIS